MAATCPQCGQSEVAGEWCPRCGANVAQYRADLESRVAAERWAPPPPPARPPAPPPAGFWIRAIAVVIDGALLLLARLVLSLVAWLVFGTAAGSRPVRSAIGLVTVVGGALYWVVLHSVYGQTVGKMAVGVRVVALGGGSITLARSSLRLAGYWVSSLALGVGYLLAAFRRDKRALHDLIAGTRVERVR